MGDWKQQIEAQIASMERHISSYKSLSPHRLACLELCSSTKALLDVAVAAEEQQARLSTTPAWKWMQDNEYTIALGDAICKLREISDGRLETAD